MLLIYIMNNEELIQEIKELWKKLDCPFDKIDKKILQGWETQYDTFLDQTNYAQFFIDRYDNPLLYLSSSLSLSQ